MGAAYIFKQSAGFGQSPKRTVFTKGHHVVPEGITKDPYFKKLMKAGLVVEAGNANGKVEAPAAPAPGSLAAKQKDAIEKQKAATSAKAAASGTAPTAAQAAGTETEAEDEAPAKTTQTAPPAKKGK